MESEMYSSKRTTESLNNPVIHRTNGSECDICYIGQAVNINKICGHTFIEL